ncbi:50S ribosomal protein L32 [Lactobacillus sp. UCMA15818]|uniref:50S ribosomal protein L32 n=1 Tax=Lactobacillaceae TaxID=33958 RepID=UPI0025AFBE24|nr:50S ribosomal protein L32 [Lactobacillus sp. UCMA15818]MDN2452392.1 50S ribosomal protein L32 [Lactobacillus sp. UCMA15818]
MAVPARKTSKSKKKMRRANKKLMIPSFSLNTTTGEYHRSHHYSLVEIERLKK